MSSLQKGSYFAGLGEKRWRWYHGVGVYTVVQGVSFALTRLATYLQEGEGKGNQEQSREFYREQNQPWFAPPAAAFGPAWAINNVTAIWALLRALNTPKGARGRSAFLALQAASWLDFAVFGAATFALRSPINGFALSASYLVLTVASLYVALARLRDPKLALALVPLCAWLVLATLLSFRDTQWNRDPLYNVGPFERPERSEVKPGFGIRQGE